MTYEDLDDMLDSSDRGSLRYVVFKHIVGDVLGHDEIMSTSCTTRDDAKSVIENLPTLTAGQIYYIGMRVI